MVEIVFHSHATTLDNEAGLASGHNDVDLTKKGRQEAKNIGLIHKGTNFAAIFCSDLKRSYLTAEIAFGSSFPIIKDNRLRECDYGELTHKASSLIKSKRLAYINKPFPGGESYRQVVNRMRNFLSEIKLEYAGQTIMIIGHGGTRFALEHLINSLPLEKCLTELNKQSEAVVFKLN